MHVIRCMHVCINEQSKKEYKEGSFVMVIVFKDYNSWLLWQRTKLFTNCPAKNEQVVKFHNSQEQNNSLKLLPKIDLESISKILKRSPA